MNGKIYTNKKGSNNMKYCDNCKTKADTIKVKDDDRNILNLCNQCIIHEY